ncbi:unnamed protein product [Rhizoctonia solani]|uniref:Nephrocystin 3-like N-terminal domain-containing protein n=1 Tax=Rhizoctonia solani TaxID=456999 RepID=A0A8H3CL14_9AGAM|nr:unnamed protein product [Rhizoctonia solani]
MPSPPPTPKRKRFILSSDLSSTLLHPGRRTKRARSDSHSGSLNNSEESTTGASGSGRYNAPQSSIRPNILSQGDTRPRHLSEHHAQGHAAPAPNIIVQNKSEISWKGLERALRALHITTQACPPLHSAIEGLKSCLHIFRDAAKPRKDYDELATWLTDIVELLIKHLSVSASGEITDIIIRIAGDIAKEVDSIGRHRSISGARRILGQFEDEEDLIRRYHRIEQLFRQLQAEASMSTWSATKRQVVNTQLESLGPVKLAAYNSKLSMDIGRRSCTKDTRTQILKDLAAWSNDPNGAKIYWMNGMAGTGKTTIAYSLCERLETTGQLAASFFCTRTSRECSEAKQIVPTIAYQLARYSAPFRDALCGVLDGNPDAGTLKTSLQFDSLLAKPLHQVGKAIGRSLVIVIDALDECNDPYAVKVVLDILLPFATDSPIKFLVTSRPEPAIRDCMMSEIEECNRPQSILYLHEIEKSLVQADIELYLKDELRDLLLDHCADIEDLAKQAGNLFIYAATAVRYIQAAGVAIDPEQRLKTILAFKKSKKSMSGIDQLYSTILSAAINNEDLEPEEQCVLKAVLWTTVCVCEPVLINTLAMLAGLRKGNLAMSALQALRSVLHVSEHNNLVTTLHASFPDFMFSRDRSGEFFCDRLGQNQILATRCLEIMKTQLRFNICQIESSFGLDNEIPDLANRIEGNISPELFYACRFWVDHLVQGAATKPAIAMVHDFMLQRLLFWMEVMNITKCMTAGALASTTMYTWLTVSTSQISLANRDLTRTLQSVNAASCLITLARDAQMFVGKYAAHVLSGSTPHIYISALPLSSPSSLIFLTYRPRFRGLVESTGTYMERVDQNCLGVWSFNNSINSASFSADGKYIVIGDDRGSISMRHAHNGINFINFQAHQSPVRSISLSSDATLIVSSPEDDPTLSVWNVSDGSLAFGPLKGHRWRINSVMFSPDGTRLVSGSEDCTIRTWVAGGACSCDLLLTRHTAPVNSVAFSLDGTQLISGSKDHTIRLWDAISGELRLSLSGHTKSVTCTRFSHCGSFVVSGSDDRTIRIWDTRKGTLIGSPFDGCSARIISISVSPDGERIASGTSSNKVQVWHRTSGKLMDGPFKGHTDAMMSVGFSADSARLMSASRDGNIRVWNAQERICYDSRKDSTHSRRMKTCTISPGGAYIVSSDEDGTLGVWNLRSGRLERVFASRSDSYDGIVKLSFSSNGIHIFAAHDDGVLEMFNAQTGELVGDPHRFSHHGKISDHLFALSSDGQSVVSTGYLNIVGSQALDLWHINPNQPTRTIKLSGYDDVFTRAIFAPNGDRFATSTRLGLINVWDSFSGQCVADLVHPDAKCLFDNPCMGFSPDGTHLFYMNGDVPRLYNLVDKTFTALPAPEYYQPKFENIVKFSPNGAYIALETLDDTLDKLCVRLFDTRGVSGEPSLNDISIPISRSHEVSSLEFVTEESCLLSIIEGDAILVFRHQVGNNMALELSDDGWVQNQSNESLIWVPPEIRDRFPGSSGSNFKEDSSITVNYDNILVGTAWSQCYVGDVADAFHSNQGHC